MHVCVYIYIYLFMYINTFILNVYIYIHMHIPLVAASPHCQTAPKTVNNSAPHCDREPMTGSSMVRPVGSVFPEQKTPRQRRVDPVRISVN